ncbi:MAG: wax ester/triacylglycerol synthase family O-acyltransferase [Deltaproteobacteria bacterium]|nr:wax ester/triacylglycerol synthase family O-acyltransferase [Deltaproteobacteria bacterium]MCB9787530.1 wax ester/triacylglycerol synthase family O-acyltransferase [Deltaproteobacteria bacterium]
MERLTGLDASFLYLETPDTHMHVAMVAVLDPAGRSPGECYRAIARLFESRVAEVPPLRRRLLNVPLDLHHPVWVDDPAFDLIHHLRRVSLPAPGDERELGAMCGRICSAPLDRARPLWETWMIDGLEGGRIAILMKVHHSVVDGTSGAGIMVHLFDLKPEPRPARPPAERQTAPLPTDMELIAGALRARVQQPIELARLAGRTVRNAFRLLARHRQPDVPDSVLPLTAPRTVFNQAIGPRRDAAFATVPLSGVKEIKNALGVTVNDVVLAIASGALRAYLDGRGELPSQSLVAVCPISVRTEGGSEYHNEVSGLFTSLATAVDDPLERVRAIAQTTRGAKADHKAIGADMLQSWAELAAPTTFHLAARFYTRLRLANRHRPIFNLVISNVPGPRFPLYIAGSKLLEVYPLGPAAEGAGLNVTVMSYQDEVYFGLSVAADLVPDLWDLAGAVAPAYEELARAAGCAAEPGGDEERAADAQGPGMAQRKPV